jgi:hypothetical protein
MKRIVTSICCLVLVQNFTACTVKNVAEVCVAKAQIHALPFSINTGDEEIEEDEFHPLMMLSIPF